VVTEFAKQVPATLLANLPEAGTGQVVSGNGRVSDARSRELAWAKASESAAALRSMIEISRGHPSVLVDHGDLDADPELLNVANCTVNLRTGHARPHDPADLLTMQSPVHFDADATAPLWESCLATWQPDPDVRRYLQVLAGACATGRPTQTLDLHYGHGANGKSMFWSTLQHCLGGYAITPDASLLIAQKHPEHKTVVASLFRVRGAIGGETRAGSALNEASVKNLTGNDALRARMMRQDEWSFWPTHTLVLFSNYKPKITGTDHGIWRRVRLVEWPVTIPEDQRDTTLDRKLAAESSGILNWIIEGARIFLTEGLTVPESVKVATDQYRVAEDVVGRFIRECLTIDGCDSTMCASADIAEVARAWSEDCGLDYPPKANAIAAALETLGAVNLGQIRHDGRRRTMWSGVCISAGQEPMATKVATPSTTPRFIYRSANFTDPIRHAASGPRGSQALVGDDVEGCRECGLPIAEPSPVDLTWCINCHAEDVRRDAMEWSI
jgi:putative DNA primase/helicase